MFIYKERDGIRHRIILLARKESLFNDRVTSVPRSRSARFYRFKASKSQAGVAHVSIRKVLSNIRISEVTRDRSILNTSMFLLSLEWSGRLKW